MKGKLRTDLFRGLVIMTVATLNNAVAQTTLTPGDLAIVGINANNGGCSGITAQDEVSFFFFKDLQPATPFIFTDNGYQIQNAGQWGDGEGVVRFQWNGPGNLPAGTVITIRASNAGASPTNISIVSPITGTWTISTLNGATRFNLNSGGDQMFFFQPSWVFPFGGYSAGTAATNDASFLNCTLLYAFNTKTLWTPYTYTGPGTGTQDSDLPPGSLCFSMNPTSATDFVKFTDLVAGGTFAARTQRIWIIDIDNAANWSSYATCALYNSSAPNYAGGYNFIITPSTFQNGLWTGAKTTNWFDCRNWDDAEVPIATSNVLINQTAFNNCDVATAGSAAICASLTVITSGTARNLTVNNPTTSLTVSGPAVVQRTAGAGPVTFSVLSGSFTANSLAITGTAPAAFDAQFRNDVPGTTVNIMGPVTLNSGGLIDMQGAATGGTMTVHGNWTNNEGEAFFQDQYSTIIMAGSSPATITTAGAVEEVFGTLRINKPASNLTLNAPVRTRANLDMISGLVISSATNLLTLDATATATNANNSSFVSGPVKKFGTANFTFPIGKNTHYRPAAVTGITGVATDAFIAEYFPASPQTTFGTNIEPTLDHISDCEYWMIDRAAGTSANAFVALSWDFATSCGVTLPADLRVARWDAGALPLPIWRDRGNGGTSPFAATGTVITAAQQTLFSPWTLASATAENPLPIELLWFNAVPYEHVVELDWATASEHGNDYFVIQRSRDAEEWTEIAHVDAAGTSPEEQDYSTIDPAPLPGLSYYRLGQTDLDGTTTWSDAVAVMFDDAGGRPLTVYVQDGVVNALHDFAAGSTVDVLDLSGRTIARGYATEAGVTRITPVGLPHGVYLLRLSDDRRTAAERFVY